MNNALLSAFFDAMVQDFEGKIMLQPCNTFKSQQQQTLLPQKQCATCIEGKPGVGHLTN